MFPCPIERTPNFVPISIDLSGSVPQPRLNSKWVEARFDRIAGSYWVFERLFLVPPTARQRSVDLLQLQPGDRALSVGCGQGKALKAISRGVQASGNVVGVDLSAEMLKRAYDQLIEHSLGNVLLVKKDFLTFEPEHKFNAVLFSLSLTSFGEPSKALHHAWELLLPGGRLVVLDAQLPPKLGLLTKPMMQLIRKFLEATVLGDPDMRTLAELEQLAPIVRLEHFRKETYFVALLKKPELPSS